MCCSFPPRSWPSPATASPDCRHRSRGCAGDVARSRRGRRSCIGVSRTPRRSPFRSCGWRSCPSRCGARCCRSSASSRVWSCPSGVRRSPRWCGCPRSHGHGRASARHARHRGRRSLPCASRSEPFASSSTTTPIPRRPRAAATCDSSPAAGRGWSWALLVASIAAFPSLTAWAVLGGGGLQPLAAHVVQLWIGCGLRSPRHGTRHDRPGRPVLGGARRSRQPLAARALARHGHPLARRAAPRRARRVVRRHSRHRSVAPALCGRCDVGAGSHIPGSPDAGSAECRARAPAAAMAVLRRFGRPAIVGRLGCGLPALGRRHRVRALARTRAHRAVGRRRSCSPSSCGGVAASPG